MALRYSKKAGTHLLGTLTLWSLILMFNAFLPLLADCVLRASARCCSTTPAISGVVAPILAISCSKYTRVRWRTSAWPGTQAAAAAAGAGAR
jgi:hypothetical protein